MACTKFGSDHCIRIEVRINLNLHQIGIAMEKLFVKRGPGWGDKWIAIYVVICGQRRGRHLCPAMMGNVWLSKWELTQPLWWVEIRNILNSMIQFGQNLLELIECWFHWNEWWTCSVLQIFDKACRTYINSYALITWTCMGLFQYRMLAYQHSSSHHENNFSMSYTLERESFILI